MIKVLQDNSEIAEAVEWLNYRGIMPHTEMAKNWDFRTIFELLDSEPRIINIVDLGCGPSRYGCVTLNSLARAGFERLVGIDIHVPLYARLAYFIALIRHGIWRKRYVLKKGNICETDLPSSFADFAILLSVIEHGVSLEDLMKEVGRIVKAGGMVYVSTDYWPSDTGFPKTIHIATGGRGNVPLPWKIFNSDDIAKLIRLASIVGFELEAFGDIPTAKDKVVSWHGYSYTFISLVFRKR